MLEKKKKKYDGEGMLNCNQIKTPQIFPLLTEGRFKGQNMYALTF